MSAMSWKQRSNQPIPPVVILQFTSYEGPLTPERRLEATALDARTQDPLVPLPLRDMAPWLGSHGFGWRPGSSGIWERPRPYRRSFRCMERMEATPEHLPLPERAAPSAEKGLFLVRARQVVPRPNVSLGDRRAPRS